METTKRGDRPDRVDRLTVTQTTIGDDPGARKRCDEQPYLTTAALLTHVQRQYDIKPTFSSAAGCCS